MGNYNFIYSVDFVTVSGRCESVLFIMDKCELSDVISTISHSGGAISAVTCAMYDANGFPLRDRDVTRLLGLKTA